MRALLCAVAAFIAFPLGAIENAAAQEGPVIPLRIARAREDVTIGGSILGFTTKNYSFEARAGQVIEIRVTAPNRLVAFNVLAPNGSALHQAMTASDPRRFTGTAPSAGAYRIAVFFNRNEARGEESAHFTLYLAIRGAGSAAARPGDRNPGGPSFNCRRAATPVEQAICASPELSQLDSTMADLYHRALIAAGQSAAPGVPGAAALREQQRTWEAERDACGEERDVRACVRESYERRIAHLQLRGGSGAPGATIVYECNTGELISARFLQTDPPSVRFVRARVEHVGVATQTASGARYVTDDNLSFWTHGADAFLEGAGGRIRCTRR